MKIFDITDYKVRAITKTRSTDPSGTPKPDGRGKGK